MAKSEPRRFEYKPRTAEQIKKRANQKSGSYDSYLDEKATLFKPKGDTDYCIRILPPTWDNAEHYGLDIHVHYGIGSDNNSYLCPKRMKNQPCPICTEREAAERAGKEEYAKELAPTRRVLAWIVDRDKQEDGPVCWAMPITFDKDVTRRAVDKRSGEVLNIDDPFEGYDIEFSREGSGFKTKYVGVEIARRDSPLSDDDKEFDTWMDYIQDNPLPSLLVFHDADYIASMFNGEESETETPAPARRERAERTETKEEEEPPRTSRTRRQAREEEDDSPLPPRARKEEEVDDEKEPEVEKEEEAPSSSRDRLRALRDRRARG